MLEFNVMSTKTIGRRKAVFMGRDIIARLSIALLLFVTSYYFVDIPVAVFCRQLDRNILQIFEWITKLGISTWYLVASFFLFLFFRFYYKRRIYANRALLFFAGVALSGIAAVLVKLTLARYRPKLFFKNGLYGFDFFHVTYEYNSFPSGHVTTIFSVAVLLSFFLPKGRVFFFIVAFVVALSRIALTAHFVSDVIAGAFIGTITILLLKKYIPAHFYNPGKSVEIRSVG
jgi:membrane-associated phospholipid phosphatase